jgi:hypothetical protein
MDHEARKQLHETRETLLAHLTAHPDDLKALVLADVVCAIEPAHDASLAVHATRFRKTRRADWKLRARELGLDRLLFHLANGWRAAEIGTSAIPVIERRATEINEARPPRVPAGHIDASFVPAGLTATFHPSGHLKRVAVVVDRNHNGELVLDETPGSGHFRVVRMRGGSGTMLDERYRDGTIYITLNTPWHDGAEATEVKPWTRWVEECLADLAELLTVQPTARRARRR